MKPLRAVTYNLGCGGPHGPAHVAGAERWAASARAEGYDLVFAQEAPSQAWLDAWAPTHHVMAVNPHGYRVRSALFVSRSLACVPLTFPTAGYHDSYVAAATVVLPDGCEVGCLSVHAPPSRVTTEFEAMWEEEGVALPLVRDGEPLWDADLLLASVVALAKHGSVLIAGDWNEARAWDATHAGSTAGAEFFARVAEGGVVDCTWDAWGGAEIPTSVSDTHELALQLDHVFATPDIAVRVHDPHVQASEVPNASDHSPLSFVLDGESAPV